MHSIQTLTSASLDLEAKLAVIQKLARQVFEPDIPQNQYESSPTSAPQLKLETWHERLSMEHATILYVTRVDSNSPNVPTSTGSPPILGFFFNFPRQLSESNQSYHIYLAAVHPSARGQNIFPQLLEKTKQMATERGYQMLTVSTIPARFQRMYGILTRPNTGWEVLEWKEGGGEGYPKVIMQMRLGRLDEQSVVRNEPIQLT
jgi:hypothetical protein